MATDAAMSEIHVVASTITIQRALNCRKNGTTVHVFSSQNGILCADNASVSRLKTHEEKENLNLLS